MISHDSLPLHQCQICKTQQKPKADGSSLSDASDLHCRYTSVCMEIRQHVLPALFPFPQSRRQQYSAQWMFEKILFAEYVRSDTMREEQHFQN